MIPIRFAPVSLLLLLGACATPPSTHEPELTPAQVRHRKVLTLLPSVRRGMSEDALTDLLGRPSVVLPGQDGLPIDPDELNTDPNPAEPHFLIYWLIPSPSGPAGQTAIDPTDSGTPRIEVCVRHDGAVESARRLPVIAVAPELPPIATTSLGTTALSLSVAGSRLLVSTEQGFAVWRTGKSNTPHRVCAVEVPGADCPSTQLSPDGRWVLVAEQHGGGWSLYHLEEHKGRLQARAAWTRERREQDAWSAGPATFSADSKSLWLAHSSEGPGAGTLSGYRLSADGSSKRFVMVDYPLGFVATCVVPSPDRILSWGYTTTNTASETHGVHAFDLKAKTKTLLKPDAVPAFDTESPESTAGHMARSSDGRTLLQGGLGFRARLWRLDGTAPRCVTSFQPEWFEPMLVDLSPSSGWALVACGQRVELWQLHLDQAYPARCASRLTGVPRNSFVMGVRFGANGKTALAATDEGELLTWDLSRLVQ